MLRVSKPKYLFDPLQRLLSPSTSDSWLWSHRCLLRSMQAEPWIKLFTKNVWQLWSSDPRCVVGNQCNDWICHKRCNHRYCVFLHKRVLLYWSVVQYNNMREKDRIARKVLCCQMAILRQYDWNGSKSLFKTDPKI